MPIELPHEVALFLNFAGVNYPDINEDEVRELATHVRNFAASVRGTQDAANGTIKDMNEVWSGYSYEQLLVAWSRISVTHVAELDGACKGVATALDVAAEVISVTKAVVLAELVALAYTYLAALAGAFATGGLAAVVSQALPMIARELLTTMEEALIAYLLSEVVGKAIEPLEHAIERMVGGALHSMVVGVLHIPPPSGSATQSLQIEPDEVQRLADLLDDYADQMHWHAADFASKMGQLDFTTARGRERPDTATDSSRTPMVPPERPTGPTAPPRAAAPAISAGSGPGLAQPAPSTSRSIASSDPSTGVSSVASATSTRASDTNSSPWQFNGAHPEESAKPAQASTGGPTGPVALQGPPHFVTAPFDPGQSSRPTIVALAAPDPVSPIGEDIESVARQPNPQVMAGPASGGTGASLWHGVPGRGRRRKRVASAGERDRRPASASSAEPPESPAVPTPWSSLGHEPEIVAKVFTPDTPLPTSWVGARRRVREGRTSSPGEPPRNRVGPENATTEERNEARRGQD
ncbi:hypothetical protein ACFVUS_27130 [Nocardia sp. NPDC058058]|uniref:WXG100-like domain-containing protein n=1 Tax=Nocardia sp. NPDC058058 TaxID=3346317 RepID=UPI0036D775F5